MHDSQPGPAPIQGDIPSTLPDDPLADVPTRAPTEADPHLSATKGDTDPLATRNHEAVPITEGFHAEGFDLLEEIGRGGMGVVYRARDRRRDQIVALKTVQGVDAALLLRFKLEFRRLADVAHPNLVALYEMISDGAVWFFTMEFVEGVDFLSHLRSEGRDQRVDWTPDRCRQLRQSFLQLAEGVQFLHASGMLHRDLKPRNVLVTSKERVLILDFGLAADLNRQGRHESLDPHLLGTIPYMSPEQAGAQPLEAASDWYSVGVMLFEVLTGRWPFTGTGMRSVVDKQLLDPPDPRDVAPDVPAEWNDLCAGLLRRDWRQRMSGAEFLQRLGGKPAAPRPLPPAFRGGASLVGREPHVQALLDALQLVRRGRPVACFVSGRSGSGKSTLIQHFLEGLGEDHDVAVFAGQCYHQESVPYKAFDGLVDSLSRYLSHLPPNEIEAVLPADIESLARVFPVVSRVAVSRGPAAAPDPRELRRRAFAALRELLTRLGRRRPLILYIDDLQWGDFDSLALLAELLRPPDPPVMLLVGTYRSEEVASSPFLQGLLAGRAKLRNAVDLRELSLEPLTAAEARDLALRLLQSSDRDAQVLADLVARESGGNPFFAQELVQQLQASGGEQGDPLAVRNLTLDTVLWRRIERLAEDARRLLTVLATAGRPLALAEAGRAAGLDAQQLTVLSTLRGQRLVRAAGLAEQDMLTTYHDRIRETVTAHMAPEARTECHRRLAEVLDATGQADPEVLAVHFQGAGNLVRAATCSAQAADRAAAALAFDRAARLYRTALELGGASHDTGGDAARRLREKLADALANAGRGGEAGHGYLALAEEEPSADAQLLFRRKASAQFLNSGHVAEGVRIARQVLAAVNLPWPATPGRALVALLARRLQLWWRGLHFRERPEKQVPDDELRRVDTSWSVAVGLSSLDPVRGAYFQSLNLLHALRAGEPYRVARALAMETCHLATSGTQSARRTGTVLIAAEAIAGRLANPHAAGMVALAHGVSRYLVGDWLEGIAGCARGEVILRDQCQGVTWELNTAQAFRLYGMLFSGQIAELTRCCPAIMKEARDRGDLYAFAHLGTFVQPFVDLAADQPDLARRDLDAIMAEWSQDEFYVQHANALLRQCEIDLYRGDATQAASRVQESWPAYSQSLILRVQHMRICAWHLRARVCLAQALQSGQRRPLLASVQQCSRKLEREGRTDALALSQAVRAAAAFIEGRVENARQMLEQAGSSFERCRMSLFAAATRHHLGRLLAGDAGKALVQTADNAMAREGIRDPARMAAVLVPGFEN